MGKSDIAGVNGVNYYDAGVVDNSIFVLLVISCNFIIVLFVCLLSNLIYILCPLNMECPCSLADSFFSDTYSFATAQRFLRLRNNTVFVQHGMSLAVHVRAGGGIFLTASIGFIDWANFDFSTQTLVKI